jgi:DNA-binding IclR family transcriptional regulator
MKYQGPPSGRIKTAQRVFDVLELAREAEEDGMTLSEVTSELDTAKSTAHRYLATLEELGYLVRDGEQFYLGLTFLQYGTVARNRLEYLDTVESTLERLAEETKETVWFAAEECGKAIHLIKKDGPDAVQTDGLIGKPAPLHATAAGKAVLSELPESRLDEIELSAYTEATITDRETLREEIAEVRETGVAYNDMESLVGLRAVGCPIHLEGEVVGAISISGPAERISDTYFDDELPAMLRSAANEIELSLFEPAY